jgi:glycosyltransferase involved in cell wall biosynthesis
MAYGIPFVGSVLPSIKEVLSESQATFFTPDNPQSLIEAIQEVRATYDVCTKVAKNIKLLSDGYTWDTRVSTILKIVNV